MKRVRIMSSAERFYSETRSEEGQIEVARMNEGEREVGGVDVKETGISV